MKVCKLHPLTTCHAKCYAKPHPGGAASAVLLVERRHSPQVSLTPILQLTFLSLGQHVTGAPRGETHSYVTYFAAQCNNSCFTKSQLVENPPITPLHLPPAVHLYITTIT